MNKREPTFTGPLQVWPMVYVYIYGYTSVSVSVSVSVSGYTSGSVWPMVYWSGPVKVGSRLFWLYPTLSSKYSNDCKEDEVHPKGVAQASYKCVGKIY